MKTNSTPDFVSGDADASRMLGKKFNNFGLSHLRPFPLARELGICGAFCPGVVHATMCWVAPLPFWKYATETEYPKNIASNAFDKEETDFDRNSRAVRNTLEDRYFSADPFHKIPSRIQPVLECREYRLSLTRPTRAENSPRRRRPEWRSREMSCTKQAHRICCRIG